MPATVFKILFALLLVCAQAVACATEPAVRVAVAANFAPTMKHIVAAYTQQTGHKVSIISGATGKHYAQIINGAPFDLFYAADSERPALLEAAGLIVPGSRYSYALGRLVLWSPDAQRVEPTLAVLREQNFQHLAIANPQLAPYGRAARETLENLELWTALQGKLVRGENIAQTYQFVSSGNAELGFLALAQLNDNSSGSRWIVPANLHSPIEQQAVLLSENAAARLFMTFMQAAQATQIIRSSGYMLPASSIAADRKSGQTE